jgi:hypothetical protein
MLGRIATKMGRNLMWKLDLLLMPVPKSKRQTPESLDKESDLRDKILRNMIRKNPRPKL